MKPILTAAEIEQLDAAIAEELPDLMQRAERREAAIAEDTLSGQLRRALLSAEIRQERAAAEAGVTAREYADWMAGDAPLPSTAFDRLAAMVHHHLQPVP